MSGVYVQLRSAHVTVPWSALGVALVIVSGSPSSSKTAGVTVWGVFFLTLRLTSGANGGVLVPGGSGSGAAELVDATIAIANATSTGTSKGTRQLLIALPLGCPPSENARSMGLRI